MEGPQPENHPSKYTEGRVRTGKEHAIRRLNWKTRKPCPTLEKLLCIYLLACEEALDHVTDEDLEPLALVVLEIQQYELEMSEKNWYSAAGGSTASQELEENVIKLRRLQCFARYGDYAVTLAHRVRKEAKDKKHRVGRIFLKDYPIRRSQKTFTRKQNTTTRTDRSPPQDQHLPAKPSTRHAPQSA